MGGWQLEVAKMAMYMAFPVGMFHYFNQPEYFEKWVRSISMPMVTLILQEVFLNNQVTDQKRVMYPPESKSHRSEIEKTIRDMREKHDNEMMAQLKDMENPKSAGI